MRVAIALASLALLAGCGRVTVSTNIHADGSFDRTVVYAVKDLDGLAGGMPTGSNQQMPKPFVTPKASTGVTVTTSKLNDENLTTVKRSLEAGSKPLNDIALLAQTAMSNEKPVATSSVEVKPLGDGKFEYLETIHYSGKNPIDSQLPPEFRLQVKKALPDGADTATIDKTTKAMANAVIHSLMGPPDPLVGDLVLNQDLALRKMKVRLYLDFDQALREANAPADRKKAFLDKILDDEISKVLGDTKNKTNPQKIDPTAQGSMVPMLYSVKIPGQLLEHNGNIDPITGDVYWALFPEAASVEDVKLRVVFLAK